jgi:DHA2 family multidrug resistance protein
MSQLAAGGFSGDQVAANLNRMIDQQAYTMAVTDVFYMSSLLFFALVAVIWFARPKPGGAGAAGGAH